MIGFPSIFEAEWHYLCSKSLTYKSWMSLSLAPPEVWGPFRRGCYLFLKPTFTGLQGLRAEELLLVLVMLLLVLSLQRPNWVVHSLHFFARFFSFIVSSLSRMSCFHNGSCGNIHLLLVGPLRMQFLPTAPRWAPMFSCINGCGITLKDIALLIKTSQNTWTKGP